MVATAAVAVVSMSADIEVAVIELASEVVATDAVAVVDINIDEVRFKLV